MLANLKGVKKLNLMGTAVTDAAIPTIRGMRQLEEVNLYRTKVGNTGLAQFEKLSNLAEIDVRYSRVTRAGVDSIRAALPSARVLYIEQSSRPQPLKDVSALAGPEWLKALGGKAPTA